MRNYKNLITTSFLLFLTFTAFSQRQIITSNAGGWQTLTITPVGNWSNTISPAWTGTGSGASTISSFTPPGSVATSCNSCPTTIPPVIPGVLNVPIMWSSSGTTYTPCATCTTNAVCNTCTPIGDDNRDNFVYFRREFIIPSTNINSGTVIWFQADDIGDLFINGTQVIASTVWSNVNTLTAAQIQPYLRCGSNVIGIRARNNTWSPAGLTSHPNNCWWVAFKMDITVNPIQPNATSTNVTTCNGGNNGTASAAPTGGIAPYTYKWNTSPVRTTASITNLTAGTYTVTITDSKGCTASQSVNVTQPAVLTATSTVSAILCNGGLSTITISATGGTPPYTYTTLDFSSGNQTGPLPLAPFQLPAGYYELAYWITDSRGCQFQGSISPNTIPQPTLLTATTTQTNVLCNGAATGSATVTASGGTGTKSYTWSTVPVQTGSTATGLAAGNYTVTVRDTNNCSITKSVTITSPAPIMDSFYRYQFSVCTYVTKILNTWGGVAPYSYVWTGGQWSSTYYGYNVCNLPTPHNLYLTVTDAVGCTKVYDMSNNFSCFPCIYSAKTDETTTSILDENPDEINLVKVYPNPSIGWISLEYPSSTNTRVEIFSIVGSKVLEQTNAEGKMEMNLSNLAKGSYLVKIASDKGSWTKKIILDK